MTINSDKPIKRQTPPAAGLNRSGKQPVLLTDKIAETLLSTPEEWYVIGSSDKWISGVKSNIENMTQKNITHLKDKGVFEIKQRRNTDTGQVDIYCRFVPSVF